MADPEPSERELPAGPVLDPESENLEDDERFCASHLIDLRSERDPDGLERAVLFSLSSRRGCGGGRTVRLSTLLGPSDLAPLFAGAEWAGTRVWRAAIRAAEYVHANFAEEATRGRSLLELGCGLGVPGMCWRLMGGRAVLTDQEPVAGQVRRNVVENFPGEVARGAGDGPTIEARPLAWSREGIQSLLLSTRRPNGFDLILNCDCVYEPLYGDCWRLLVDAIDELLLVNPRCVSITSVERRAADGIDKFLDAMRGSDHVESVKRVWVDEENSIEIYVTRGKVP